MCGIIGYVGRNGRPVDAARLRGARDLLAKRGPDDAGLWAAGEAGFGHRRLAVLDLTEAGHQPMVTVDGRYVIVFNGEVYNFSQLRKHLGDSAFPWRSHSDTEVILAAYITWGVDCLHHFRGMYAFAIWDRHEQRLFAARDRMGVKPFYYRLTDREFGFASRPRALIHLLDGEPWELDEQALRLYLESGYVPAPFSFFRGMQKLPPAHCLTFDRSGLRIERYWDFRDIEPVESWCRRSEDDLLDELGAHVRESVRLRMVSDVPVGAFLSGGIDSSLVTALMTRESPGQVRTFTIGFREARYDESEHAAAVSKYLGTEHHCEELGVDDLLDLLPEFVREYDEPFFDHSAFPTMAVARMTRRHVTVALSGDGGDELFGGYHYYGLARRLAPLFRLPYRVRSAFAEALARVPSHRLQLLAGAMRQRDEAAAFSFMRSIGKDFRGIVQPHILIRTTSLSRLFSETAAVFPRNLDPAERGMRLDASYILPDDYLQKVDVSTMAFSLEAREPLLDHKLVEWCMRLPIAWKLRGGRTKYLLRKLAYRYVPASIVDRPKQGFGTPVDAWLRGPLRNWARERIEDPAVFQKVPLDQDCLRRLFQVHQQGRRDVHPLLWAALMVLAFADHWFRDARQPSTEGARTRSGGVEPVRTPGARPRQ